MAKRKFTPNERYAVYTAHGEKCYICHAILDMASLEIDHVIPESLSNDKTKLAEVLEHLGRPSDFNLNSYENWMPICRKCNSTKSNMVWESSLAVQLVLQKAKAKADKARSIATKTLNKRELRRALELIELARLDPNLDDASKALLLPLAFCTIEVREVDMSKEPIRFTTSYTKPLHELIFDDGTTKLVRGPYGVGGGPSGTPSEQMRCPSCGHWYYSGGRCITCGDFGDF